MMQVWMPLHWRIIPWQHREFVMHRWAHWLNKDIGATPLVHITCRDRNLIGLQSHLMGLHTLGITELLAITGDPTKIGDFPGATSVFDVTSFELIQLIKQFNEGISWSGKSLQQKTSFTVAAAFNPNVRHLRSSCAEIGEKNRSWSRLFYYPANL